MKILLNENDQIFDQIHKEATREQKLKEKLIHMQSWLNELHYRMTKYRPALKISTGLFPLERRHFDSFVLGFSWSASDVVVSATVESIPRDSQSKFAQRSEESVGNDFGQGDVGDERRSLSDDQHGGDSSTDRRSTVAVAQQRIVLLATRFASRTVPTVLSSVRQRPRNDSTVESNSKQMDFPSFGHRQSERHSTEFHSIQRYSFPIQRNRRTISSTKTSPLYSLMCSISSV